MANELPKVQRRDGKNPWAMWILLGVIVSLVVVIGVLLASGPLFNTGPKSDLDRDYQLLLEGLKKNPKNAALLMTLAETEWQLGKKADAMDHAEKAMANAKGQSGYPYRYAQLLIQDDQLDPATKQLKAEIKLSGKNNPEPYFLLAQVQRDGEKYKDAVKNMKKGLKLAPQAADMLIVYGDILEKSGKKKQAIAQYKQALRFLPNDPKAAAALKRLGAKVPSSTTEAPNGPGGTGMPPIPVPTPSGN